MSKDRNQIEEQALDALLIEALGQVEPPDLTTPILHRLSNRDGHQEVGTIVAAPTRAKPVSSASSVRRHAVAWTLVLTAAVAASIVMIVWIRGDSEADTGALIAANESNAPDAPQLATTGTDVTPETNSVDAPSLPPRGIPLVMDPTTESTREPSPDESVNEPAVPGPVPGLRRRPARPGAPGRAVGTRRPPSMQGASARE